MSLAVTHLIGFGNRRAVSEQTVTWNPADKRSNVSLTNSDLTAGSSSPTFGSVRATLGRSTGKYYYEILCTTMGSTRTGLGDGSFSLTTYVGNSAKSGGFVNSFQNVSGFTVDNSGTFALSNGDYLMFAVDGTSGKAWVGKNNAWQLSGDPAAGTGQWISWTPPITIYPATSVYETNVSFTLRTKTSQVVGTVPSGFSVWAANT